MTEKNRQRLIELKSKSDDELSDSEKSELELLRLDLDPEEIKKRSLNKFNPAKFIKDRPDEVRPQPKPEKLPLQPKEIHEHVQRSAEDALGPTGEDDLTEKERETIKKIMENRLKSR